MMNSLSQRIEDDVGDSGKGERAGVTVKPPTECTGKRVIRLFPLARGRRRRGVMGLGTCSCSASGDLQLYFWQIMKKSLILVTLYFWHILKTSLTLLPPSVCLLSPGCFLPVLFSSLSGTNWLLAPRLFDTKLNSWRFLDYRNIMSCRDWRGMSKAFAFSRHYYRAIKSDFFNLIFCFSRSPGVWV